MFDRLGKPGGIHGPSLRPDVGSFTRPVTRSIYVAVLAKDQPSPLAPESDEEKALEAQKDAPKSDEAKPGPSSSDAPKPGIAPKPADVKIDFDNISQRVLAMPLPPRRYVALRAGKAGVLFAVEAPLPAPL